MLEYERILWNCKTLLHDIVYYCLLYLPSYYNVFSKIFSYTLDHASVNVQATVHQTQINVGGCVLLRSRQYLCTNKADS